MSNGLLDWYNTPFEEKDKRTVFKSVKGRFVKEVEFIDSRIITEEFEKPGDEFNGIESNLSKKAIAKRKSAGLKKSNISAEYLQFANWKAEKEEQGRPKIRFTQRQYEFAEYLLGQNMLEVLKPVYLAVMEYHNSKDIIFKK